MILLIFAIVLIRPWERWNANTLFVPRTESSPDGAWTKQDVECTTVEEHVLWSSGYNFLPEGSTNYQIWYPKYNCSELNSPNCFLTGLKVKSRFIPQPIPDDESEGIGFVQISELDNCSSPQTGNYSHFLAYEKVLGEEMKQERYCGSKKGIECESEIAPYIGELNNCYGIKSHASQYMLTDVFEVNYTLCIRK